MAVKLDKVMGRLREKDAHRCGIEVSCAVPQVTLEMQLRKCTDIAVTGRLGKDGQPIGTDTDRLPASYTVKRRMRGEWTVWLRYFGDASTLDGAKIGVLHKSRLCKAAQHANPLFGTEGEEDADVEVFVRKTLTKGWLLMREADGDGTPVLLDLPANEGEWTPLMQVDEFVEQFIYFKEEYKKAQKGVKTNALNYQLVPHHFKNRYARIGDDTKWSEFNINSYKAARRAIYTRAGLAVVQERIFADQLTGYNRTAYAYAQPTYFTMRYAPKCETPYNILL